MISVSPGGIVPRAGEVIKEFFWPVLHKTRTKVVAELIEHARRFPDANARVVNLNKEGWVELCAPDESLGGSRTAAPRCSHSNKAFYETPIWLVLVFMS